MNFQRSAVSIDAGNGNAKVDDVASIGAKISPKNSPKDSSTDMKKLGNFLESASMYSGQTEQLTVSTFDVSSSSGGGSPSTKESRTVPMTVAVATGEPTSSKTRARAIPIIEAAGGTDKDPKTGHRRDTIPMMEAIANHNCVSEVLQFQEEFAEFEASGVSEEMVARRNNGARANNEAIRSVLLGEDGDGAVAGVIVRCNPGTLSAKTQFKLDAMLTELDQQGVRILSHPEVYKRMGAKDALCKIRHLRCGMEDTEVYYDAEALQQGFRKSVAFRPRVMKQNRGSQGEGIWICKLKDETAYCKNYGDAIADLDTPLVLTEANDNHVEEHTVGEFLEFCLHGRTDKAGHWDSLGRGKYLEGGLDSGAMLVDQRFLPRIVEGEVRCLMVGPNLVELIHKKPKAGGLSATLLSGAIYTMYKPDAPEFATLVENFQHDLPKIMACFNMENQPLPLLWTADYIFGEPDENGQDTFYVGEFNCTCVGITKNLDSADLVARTAIETVLGESS
jgi:glutathione synthase/RimK-type ligase-like ATP-grasp enzyme